MSSNSSGEAAQKTAATDSPEGKDGQSAPKAGTEPAAGATAAGAATNAADTDTSSAGPGAAGSSKPEPAAAKKAEPPAAAAAAAATTATAAKKPTPHPTAAKKPPPKPVAKGPPAKPGAAPPAPSPEFEKGMSDRIVAKFGDRVESTFIKPARIGIRAGRDDVHEVAEFIRDELSYDHVESVSGVDYPADGEIEVVYHIGSYTDDSLANQVIALSTRAQREDEPIPGGDATRLPSLRDVFYSVEFHEREIFEMLGVYFEGHPDNRRLLLPEDWADLPPLRKDFAIKGR